MRHNQVSVSVSEFRQRCLEIIRELEKTGKPVMITRRGKVVARLQPLPFGDHHGVRLGSSFVQWAGGCSRNQVSRC
jgi:prevent-host-death family protein